MWQAYRQAHPLGKTQWAKTVHNVCGLAGTDSILTVTKIVSVRKENIPFMKNNESPTPTYPETRNS